MLYYMKIEVEKSKGCNIVVNDYETEEQTNAMFIQYSKYRLCMCKIWVKLFLYRRLLPMIVQTKLIKYEVNSRNENMKENQTQSIRQFW